MHSPRNLSGAKVKARQQGLPDIHEEDASINVLAGVSNLRLVYNGRGSSLPIKLTILAATNNHRGVHMSRLVAAAQKNSSVGPLEAYLRKICQQVNLTQPNCRVICELEYPRGDRFSQIRLKVTEGSPIRYAFNATGTTACPCSLEMVGIGHMQRTDLSVEIASKGPLDFDSVLELIDECFSTVPEEHLKRPEEGEKILEAQANPRFAEDVVRECLKRFPHAERIEARSFESIHTHDAVSLWVKPMGS